VRSGREQSGERDWERRRRRRRSDGGNNLASASRSKSVEEKSPSRPRPVTHLPLSFESLASSKKSPPPCSDVPIPLRIGDIARTSMLRALLDCASLLFGQQRRRKHHQSRRCFRFRFRSTTSSTRRAGHLRVARRLQPPLASVAVSDEGILRQRARQRYVWGLFADREGENEREVNASVERKEQTSRTKKIFFSSSSLFVSPASSSYPTAFHPLGRLIQARAAAPRSSSTRSSTRSTTSASWSRISKSRSSSTRGCSASRSTPTGPTRSYPTAARGSGSAGPRSTAR